MRFRIRQGESGSGRDPRWRVMAADAQSRVALSGKQERARTARTAWLQRAGAESRRRRKRISSGADPDPDPQSGGR